MNRITTLTRAERDAAVARAREYPPGWGRSLFARDGMSDAYRCVEIVAREEPGLLAYG